MAHATYSGSREQYWRGYLTRWEASGLSVREFCEFHDLSQQSFYWWRREIARRDQAKAQFLPVQVISDEPPAPADGGAVEIVLAQGRLLRVRPGFDPQTLVRVVEVLEAGGRPC
jgi:transposase